ncbi:MAG: response regulator [Marinicaulis sp.]|nr:response regulator [Marinicaulis sp.]
MTPPDPATAQKQAAADIASDTPEDAAAIDANFKDAPRPPTPEEIVAMMDEAAESHRDQKGPIGDEILPGGEVDHGSGAASFWILWACIFSGLAAVGYFILTTRQGDTAALIIGGLVTLFAAAFIFAATTRNSSPLLLAGAMMRRAGGKPAGQAAELAGAEILSALGLAERVLDADVDACLVTRRDGVVTYANRAYFDLAKNAGVMGPAGLPPRIDRLFAQQGAEATKVFRLCRAAKSAAPADETIFQVMGIADGGVRRRFHVSVRPIRGSDEHVAWRLREMPAEEEEHDVLAAAYADFPHPVFAIEKSGQIAWANAALREELGVDRGGLRHIDDFILGETSELVRALWRLDGARIDALVRRKNADPIEAQISAFRRGGVGEGFACVQLGITAVAEDVKDISLSGDIAESPFGIAIVDGELNRDGRIHAANKAFAKSFGSAKQNAPLSRMLPQETLEDLARETKKKSRPTGGLPAVETEIETDGQQRTYAIFPRPVKRKRGSYGARRTLLYSVDITDRKRMEEETGQDQRLRGIGELASKVAHDFNNYLQVVLGHTERLMLKHPAGDPAYQELVQIRENAQRAANTTKQLLAFSRKQTLKSEVLSITEVLQDFSRFLTRAIGEKVSLDLINGRGLAPVKVDRHQLETAIMNLAVNARDAMGAAGGKLTIRTTALSAEDISAFGRKDLAENDHVLIEISDTGPGVPKDIADKIFEPFFTTKDAGKGTGLGLSTVYGSIKQMGGAIALESDAGKGAIFKIFLQAHDGAEDSDTDMAPAPSKAPVAAPTDLTGAGRILIVEDETPVRTFVVATLTDCGYEVVEAEDGEDALEILEEDGADFDLVLSDVMMNVLDGPAFVKQAREQFDLESKIIFMSAYAEEAVRDDLDMVKDAGYIQKPFTVKGLAAQVKLALTPEDE